MSYLDTRRGPSFGSMAAVVAIHGGVAAALIIGLTVSGVIPIDEEPILTWDITRPPPPPPPTTQPTQQADPINRKVTVSMPPLPLPQASPKVETTTDILPPQPPIQPGLGEAIRPIPSLAPSFAPVGAKPRNDPLRWVTTDDYRGNWIRQEMTGKARFRLEIAADGRVADCTITGSSGHPELDAATCALVSKRAKFQPARGAEGEPVAGSYSNTIDWRLPE